MDRVSCIAIDLGASSGRVILSTFGGENIEFEEVYRFPNRAIKLGDRYYWDFLGLYNEVVKGLREAAKRGKNIISIGIDTWGVDYGLLDKEGNLIGLPIHYRDDRTKSIVDDVEDVLPFSEIYKKTGIQKMAINTLYQLCSDKTIRSNILENADALLFIPDLLNYYLTGEMYNEYTVASTSQLLNAEKRGWDMDIISSLGLPTDIFQPIINPGEIYGYLKKDIGEELGLSNIPVIAVASHDTASAVVGTPLEGNSSAYLSCGTWSLLGAEIDEPIISEKSHELNFTNEGGVEGTIRLLKNINGLWIIQQLRSAWSQDRYEVSFGDIIEAAKEAEHTGFSIDPEDSRFMAPENMMEAIIDFCVEDGQGEPKGLGEIAIAAYNGLVSKYAKTIGELEDILGRKIETINMVGGGIQDILLCQMTANATGKAVVAGPIEASTMGNSLTQFIASGHIQNIDEGRSIIKSSFDLKRYRPTTS